MYKGPQPNIIYSGDTPAAAGLKRLCNRKKLTQYAIAVALKASPHKINLIFNNKSFPDYPHIVELIKRFGMTATDLFGEDVAQKLKENEEKYLESKKQPTSVGQTPEKYVSVTLACKKNPVVTNTEPPKPEPVPEPVQEPVQEPVKKTNGYARREVLTSKLAMLFSANN